MTRESPRPAFAPIKFLPGRARLPIARGRWPASPRAGDRPIAFGPRLPAQFPLAIERSTPRPPAPVRLTLNSSGAESTESTGNNSRVEGPEKRKFEAITTDLQNRL